MTTAYGVSMTKYRSGGGANVIDRGVVRGNVEYIIETYEASTLASGSTIAVGKPLNTGDIILGGDLYFDDLSSGTTTVSVGDVNTSALYLTLTDCASAAGHATFDKVDGIGYIVGTTANDEQILLTSAGGTAASGTIKVVVRVGRIG